MRNVSGLPWEPTTSFIMILPQESSKRRRKIPT